MPPLADRLLEAATTWPDPRGWAIAALTLALYAAFALGLGIPTGYLQPAAPPLSRTLALRTAAIAFWLPGVWEEVLFRVLPLPHPREATDGGSVLALAAIALVLFLVAHPLYGAASGSRGMRDNARDRVYLTLTAGLGLACTGAYLATGSLWPPVAVHWIAAIAWLLFLGGHQRLNA